jgi:micrococcal nuclease
MRNIRTLICTLIALLVTAVPTLAQDILGRVVGVSDGDTLTILTADKHQFKIRLNGIDTPETGQPYGSVAKQFTSKAAFGKDVRAVVKDVDRYGRTVAVVLIGNTNLNQSLVKNGYAWWYRQYAPNDNALKQLEFEARTAKRGLWADKSPIPPWDWRKGARPVAKATSTTSTRPLAPRVHKPVSAIPVSRTVYITRTGARYHEDGCRHLRRSQIAISLKDAEAQGFGPCLHCH